MVSGLLAAIAAFLTALLTAIAPGESPSNPQEVDGRDDTRETLRREIADLHAELMAIAGLASPSDVADVVGDESQTGSVTPRIELPQFQTQSTADTDGCTREETSGDGWTTTLVRCIQTSGGSVSVISSSNVNVQETNSSDAP